MSPDAPTTAAPFNTAERALIRYEFVVRFSQAPSLADGIWLRTWKSGPLKGQAKVPPALASMRERGLVQIAPAGATPHHGHRAMFTQAGVAALRLMARDRRALDPVTYAHLRQELGIDGRTEAMAAVGLGADDPGR